MGLKAAPTPAAPRLMARAVTAEKPRRRVRSRSTGTSAMISSCMFSSAPAVANARLTDGDDERRAAVEACTSHPTPWRSAPVSSTTVKAPPTRKTSAITDAGRDEAPRHGDERLEEIDGARGDLVIGAGHHHRPASRRVVPPLVLAGGQHVAQGRAEQDAGGEKRERVRKAQSHRRAHGSTVMATGFGPGSSGPGRPDDGHYRTAGVRPPVTSLPFRVPSTRYPTPVISLRSL